MSRPALLPCRLALITAALLSGLVLASCGDKQAANAGNGRQASGPEPLPAAGSPVRPKPMTRDPATALRHMLASYRELNSLHVSSDTSLEVKIAKKPAKSIQVTTIRFVRQPARLRVLTRDTQTGSIELVVDGRNMYFYSGTDNAYQKRAFTGDLIQASEAMDRYAYQLLSPLAFQHGEGLPHGAANLKYLGLKQLGTKQAHVVTGAFSPDFVMKFGMSMQNLAEFLKPGRSGFTLWLDKETYLLLQSKVELRWTGSRQESLRLPAAENPHILYTEKVVQFIPNPALREGQFKFDPPEGAKEVFVERKGL